MSELTVGTLSGLAANSYVIDVASGSTLDLSNATSLPTSALPAGTILQVASVTKTDTFSTTSASYVDVTGLSVNITPSSASNKILIMANLSIGDSGGATHAAFWQITGGNAGSYVGDTAGSRIRTISFSQSNTSAYNFSGNVPMFSQAGVYLDSPATTSAITYKIQLTRGLAGTAYVNRSGGDADTTSYGRGASTLTVMEVAA